MSHRTRGQNETRVPRLHTLVRKWLVTRQNGQAGFSPDWSIDRSCSVGLTRLHRAPSPAAPATANSGNGPGTWFS
jgi:hypothetical protein